MTRISLLLVTALVAFGSVEAKHKKNKDMIAAFVFDNNACHFLPYEELEFKDSECRNLDYTTSKSLEPHPHPKRKFNIGWKGLVQKHGGWEHQCFFTTYKTEKCLGDPLQVFQLEQDLHGRCTDPALPSARSAKFFCRPFSENGIPTVNGYFTPYTPGDHYVTHTVPERRRSLEPLFVSGNETQPLSDETQPLSDETQPLSDETQPLSDKTQPSSNKAELSSNEAQPNSNNTQSRSDETQLRNNNLQPRDSYNTKIGLEEGQHNMMYVWLKNPWKPDDLLCYTCWTPNMEIYFPFKCHAKISPSEVLCPVFGNGKARMARDSMLLGDANGNVTEAQAIPTTLMTSVVPDATLSPRLANGSDSSTAHPLERRSAHKFAWFYSPYLPAERICSKAEWERKHKGPPKEEIRLENFKEQLKCHKKKAVDLNLYPADIVKSPI
ncbi:hypothetical protein BS50DRAFT_615474 [Corynespora cassiicola Philippines]|uniref:Uncharacterized protein n=1 Tax=Corynespora cassiicola Philippines TaxID=1448308 RepID=A0A2T2PAD1_CORCC|nr:hypothetical protein BS50DRAFT_615474 [Corynespora cassiicola Philippines]